MSEAKMEMKPEEKMVIGDLVKKIQENRVKIQDDFCKFYMACSYESYMTAEWIEENVFLEEIIDRNELKVTYKFTRKDKLNAESKIKEAPQEQQNGDGKLQTP